MNEFLFNVVDNKVKDMGARLLGIESENVKSDLCNFMVSFSYEKNIYHRKNFVLVRRIESAKYVVGRIQEAIQQIENLNAKPYGEGHFQFIRDGLFCKCRANNEFVVKEFGSSEGFEEELQEFVARSLDLGFRYDFSGLYGYCYENFITDGKLESYNSFGESLGLGVRLSKL